MRRIKFISSLFAVFFLLGLPTSLAHAQQSASALSETGAATISVILDNLLAPSTQAVDVNAQKSGFQWQGKTETKIVSGAYLVNLPHLIVTNRKGERYYWSNMTIQLTPASLGVWAIEITLPNSVARYGQDGRRNGLITIGQNFISGSFTPGKDARFKLQAILDQFIISTLQGDIDSRIAKAKINLTLQSKPTGTWQANLTSDLAGVSWQRFDGRSPLKMQNGRFVLAGDDLDLAAYLSQKNKGSKLGKDISNGIFGGLLKTFQMQLASDHLVLPKKSSEEVLNLENFLVNLKFDDLNQAFSNVSVRYRHQNMTAVPPKENDQLSPKNLDFAFTAERLPNQKIWDSIVTYVVDTDTIGEEKAATNFGTSLKEILADAKSSIRLDTLRVEMPSTSALISGNLTVTNASPRPVYGELSLVIRDLKKTWHVLSQNKESSFLDRVGMEYVIDELADSGRTGRDAKGNLVHSYKIKISPEGRIMMNDTDITKYILN